RLLASGGLGRSQCRLVAGGGRGHSPLPSVSQGEEDYPRYGNVGRHFPFRQATAASGGGEYAPECTGSYGLWWECHSGVLADIGACKLLGAQRRLDAGRDPAPGLPALIFDQGSAAGNRHLQHQAPELAHTRQRELYQFAGERHGISGVIPAQTSAVKGGKCPHLFDVFCFSLRFSSSSWNSR